MNERVARHYEKADIVAVIEGALRAAGKDPANLEPADLAPVDEFHVRGRTATKELAGRLGVDGTMHVLDVGSGLGGPSRLLAAEYGCRVSGIDLTAAYCEAAAVLAGWVGLDGLVSYRQGDALDLPFDDNAFDAAWTIHAAMNISDKPRMYAEVRRVLRPGGRFAVYDVLQGAGGEAFYPAPWARHPSISFLVTPDELRALLAEAGFAITGWRDTTELGRDWFRQVAARLSGGGPPPLGFHLLLGEGFAEMAGNQRRNLEENRIAMIEAVCEKPG
ncbi:MAG: methyltransferase domain-containing protein [Rhodospirillales bacterium]|nr:methyltransferase domain-containing protein [Rhodospirillales bacterium]MDP6772928.1 methyltransferase domain-containing protein [Rhodospirillales bacterium]